MDRRGLLKGIGSTIGWSKGLKSRLLHSLYGDGLISTQVGPTPNQDADSQTTRAPFSLDPTSRGTPNFDDFATIEAQVNGAPVYGLDYMMYVYGIGPDLMPGTVMQEGNTNPCVKIKPKKSWEIKHNLLGSSSLPPPRIPQNDLQPFLPIHLIDGSPDSIWCSFGSIKPDSNPEWIRIDLPIESTVASLALILNNKNYPGSNFGKSLPKELTVKLSRDAWHWETVYDSQNIDIETRGTLELKFDPRRAKQIWVIGNNFPKPLGRPEHGFSIGELEVRDPAGYNLALVSRGAGVTVSSTNFTASDSRLTQNALLNPLNFDAGMKWLRVAAVAAGPYQWVLMEKARGKYKVDPAMDQWFTDLRRGGINLMLALDMTWGNPIYQNPPKQIDWVEARWKGLLDTGVSVVQTFDLVVNQSSEMFEAWLRYVDFMVRHFKGRVYIYEVGNEWNDWGWDDRRAERYMKLFARAYETIKKADPDARVLPGSINTFAPDLLLTMLGKDRRSGTWGGRLVANGADANDLSRSTLLVNDQATIKDAELHVDALNRGLWGVVLRYNGPNSFLMAGYGTYMKRIPNYRPYAIFITERTGDEWSTTQVTTKDTGTPLSEKIHLTVRLEGAQATLTVSDGNRIETVQHLIKDERLKTAGAVGLLQLNGASQAFSNFQILNLAGKTVLDEKFQGEDGTLPAGWKYVFGPYNRNPIEPGWAPKLDGIGWHPQCPPDRAYFEGVRELGRECRELGFKGRFYDTELYHFFSYPPWAYPTEARPALSELQAGILSMISAVGHSGVDTAVHTQVLHFGGLACADSNCRVTWANQVCAPVQPSVMYYMWRTVATVLDDFHPVEFEVKFTEEKKLLHFTFQRGSNEKMVAVWLDHAGANPPNEIVEARSDMTLLSLRAKQGWIIDLMNGTEQELLLTENGQNTFVREIRVKSYPTIIRFTH